MTHARTPSADPTRASLWAGRAFTTLTFGLAVASMMAALGGMANGVVAGTLAIAGLIYLVGAVILYVRRDYILRLFGCGWPLFLPKVDELQLAHRQRAFAATFATFASIFSFGMGLQLGAMLMQLHRDQEVAGLLPTEPEAMMVILVVVLLFLAIAPQAYLAWTLKPLDDEEAA